MRIHIFITFFGAEIVFENDLFKVLHICTITLSDDIQFFLD